MAERQAGQLLGVLQGIGPLASGELVAAGAVGHGDTMQLPRDHREANRPLPLLL